MSVMLYMVYGMIIIANTMLIVLAKPSATLSILVVCQPPSYMDRLFAGFWFFILPYTRTVKARVSYQ